MNGKSEGLGDNVIDHMKVGGKRTEFFGAIKNDEMDQDFDNLVMIGSDMHRESPELFNTKFKTKTLVCGSNSTIDFTAIERAKAMGIPVHEGDIMTFTRPKGKTMWLCSNSIYYVTKYLMDNAQI